MFLPPVDWGLWTSPFFGIYRVWGCPPRALAPRGQVPPYPRVGTHVGDLASKDLKAPCIQRVSYLCCAASLLSAPAYRSRLTVIGCARKQWLANGMGHSLS